MPVDETALPVERTTKSEAFAPAEGESQRLASILMPALSVDADGRVDDVNALAEALLGVLREDLMGRDITRLVRIEDLAALDGLLTSPPGEPVTIGLVRPSDGARIRLRWTPWLARSSTGARGWSFLLADVSQAEQRARSVQALMGSLALATLEVDAGGTVTSAGGQIGATLGLEAGDIGGRRFWDLVHPDDEELARQALDAVDHQNDLFVEEFRTLDPSGEVGVVRVAIRPAGLTGGRHLVLADAQRERPRVRGRDALLARSPLAVAVLGEDGRIDDANEGFVELVGGSRASLRGRELLDLVHESDVRRVEEGLAARLDSLPMPILGDVRFRRANGRPLWLRLTLTNEDPDEASGTVLLTAHDVSAVRSATEQAARTAAIVGATSDLVALVLPRSGRVDFLNPAGHRMLGLEMPFEGRASDLFADVGCHDVWGEVIAPSLEASGRWDGEVDLVGAPLHHRLWLDVGTDLDSEGRLGVISILGRDVTERRQVDAELEWRASHDPLTGLPNRVGLLPILQDELDEGVGRPALLMVDLDRFGRVNDRLGHEVGEAVLGEIARRMSDAVRPRDRVARVGGDEFAIVCSRCHGLDDALLLARRVSQAIEGSPVVVGADQIAMTASIGLVLAAEDDTRPEQMVREADMAMYRAKKAGGARLEVFREGERHELAQRRRLADELATAVDRSLIVPHFQPIVELESGRLVGAEALARWQHPVRGLVGPDQFIALAEETGAIVALGNAILQSVCGYARRWDLDRLAQPFVLHVNLSARQLASRDLAPQLLETIDRSGLDPARLCLEITESLLMEDSDSVVDSLDDLRSAGVGLAIDDFGTGYSSLAYLRRLPVDVVKIDRAFVADLEAGSIGGVITRSVVGLAQSLGLTTVAEGVETEAQAQILASFGCDMAQGFFYAPAAPPERFAELVELASRGDVTPLDLRRTSRLAPRALPPASRPVASLPSAATTFEWPDLADDLLDGETDQTP